MLEVYKDTEEGIESTEKIHEGCWIRLIDPSNEEKKDIIKQFDFPEDFLSDPLDEDESGRVELDDGQLLIIVKAPRIEDTGSTQVFTTTIPIGIIITKNIIVTICKERFDILEDLRHQPKNICKDLDANFILNILQKTAQLYIKLLSQINRQLSILQRSFHGSPKNKKLIELLNIEKNLVYITTSLKSNQIVLNKIQKLKLIKINEENEELLEDVIIDTKQAIEMAEIYSNISSKMMSSFSSVISNNLSASMKFLTTVTIILMLPTLIASIYGMNIALPFQDWPHIFYVLMAISFVLTVTGIGIFWLRKKE